MPDHAIFALSAALAQVLTNLDNLAALIALILVLGAAKAVAGYVVAQGIVLAGAMAVALGMSGTVPGWTGYLGVIPLGLGLVGLWRQFSGGGAEKEASLSSGASLLVTTLLFLSLSMDSFVVMAPLLADSLPSYRVAGVIGAALAVLGLGALALVGSRAAGPMEAWTRRLEKLGPFVMLLVGLYILSNSGTDMVP
ncbi:hypothetical protein [Ruegeria sp. HKCCD8929]|uniref:hypothetical protein n=1 Tax=Ruegeria sp. HKCCD8929 TaxID=2683006 RepID=UPI001489796B|nr:hypothetical protein [Ruegeria sp. HKCCD8929]